MKIAEPLPTRVFERREAFSPEADGLYVYGTSDEGRSHLPDSWRIAQHCEFLQVRDLDGFHMVVDLGADKIVPLRSDQALEDLLSAYAGRRLYLDITGLPHHIWAAVLRSALLLGLTVEAVYVEPERYRFSDVPRPGEIFDLSLRIEGISPLPGFTRLRRRFDDSPVFVPMLGFEGARFHYVLATVQPEGNMTIPVVGLPGFRLEYPFYTYEGNQPALQLSQGWRDVRYAAGNCPFEAFFAVRGIARDYPDHNLAIAPIGTKPHAVGAILFSLLNPDRTEIVYDHPVRSTGRTEGEYRTLVYGVSRFYEGNLL